jgi:hypothetical protein
MNGIPSIAANETVHYVLGYPDAVSFNADPVISARRNNEVLIYFCDVDSVTPVRGLQVLTQQTGSIDPTLWNDPALMFALVMSRMLRGQSAVLTSIYPADRMAQISVVLSQGPFIVHGVY